MSGAILIDYNPHPNNPIRNNAAFAINLALDWKGVTLSNPFVPNQMRGKLDRFIWILALGRLLLDNPGVAFAFLMEDTTFEGMQAKLNLTRCPE